MINSSFNFFKHTKIPEYLINQKKLTDLIHENHHISKGGCVRHAEPPTSDYPGMNIKYLSKNWQAIQNIQNKKKPQGQISILLFNSGATIITGGKNFLEYKEVYDWIRSAVTEYEDTVIQSPQEWEKKLKPTKVPLYIEDFSILYPIVDFKSTKSPTKPVTAVKDIAVKKEKTI